MMPRFKKVQKIKDQVLEKHQFLEEHNKLSPLNLRTTLSTLSRFRLEKASLFKDDNWSLEKLRRPFIMWLTSLESQEREASVKKTETNDGKFHQFPQKTGSSNCCFD